MANELVPVRAEALEHADDGIFSDYTHPVLEGLIQRVVNQNRDALPTDASRKLVRELFLYGFIRASGQEFLNMDMTPEEREMHPDEFREIFPQISERAGTFKTNNGVLGLCDFNGEVYIRGGDSYHGFFPDDEAEMPQGVEGSLLSLGYRPSSLWVPHSSFKQSYSDAMMEKLFRALHYFSKKARNLRGEPTSGMIVKDLSEPEPPAPYKSRDPSLARINLLNTILIPGNRERVIQIYR